MSNALFRAIVGNIMPNTKDADIPTPYRLTSGPQTAMKVKGSTGEPDEAKQPITNTPVTKSISPT